MQNKCWWKEAVVYQIYPRSFKDTDGDGVGDIRGIIEKLDYIKSLGVNAVWLCPVYPSPNDDNGYDISDYRGISSEFGSMQDFEELLDGLHQRGIRLIMDLVVNHTSDEHAWFIESRSDKNSPYRDYYVWRDAENGRLPNNWVSFFGGDVWGYDEKTDQYYLHLFSKKQPDLNWENPKVREEVFSMMNWWLDKGIDGFRMDVINLISKTPGLPSVGDGENPAWGGEYFMNGEKMPEYLDEMYESCLKGRDVMTVGEMPGVTVEYAGEYAPLDGNRLNMVFQFELMELDGPKTAPLDFNPVPFKENIIKWQTGLAKSGWNSIYLNNHDQPRMVSRFGNDKEYHSESAKMLVTLTMSLKGTPYVYQGEEIGMTNVSFKDISQFRDIETLNSYNSLVPAFQTHEQAIAAWNRRSRDNARTPFQWDSSLNGGFSEAEPWIETNGNYRVINVEAQQNDPDSILNYYRKMIALRHSNDTLVYGEFSNIEQENTNIFAYTRSCEGVSVLVLLNLTGESAKAAVPENISINVLLISNYADAAEKDMMLRPYEARIYSVTL